MKKILSLAVTSFLLTGTFFSSVPAIAANAADTKEKQKIQHDLHPSGRACTQGHGMDDEKVDLTPAAIIACLFKAVPDLQ